MDIKEIANGEHDGKIVYVSDIRHNGNPFEKMIRNIKPIEVMIMNNNTLPKNKKIYYSKSHFVKLKKDGTPSKTVIGIFDNTGHRSFTGTALNVFATMKECELSYKKQKSNIIIDMEKEIGNLKEKIKVFKED